MKYQNDRDKSALLWIICRTLLSVAWGAWCHIVKFTGELDLNAIIPELSA